jgi:hypothetical protein
LKDYTDRLCSVLDEVSERVILVGHSMGAIVITQTAEYRPDKIKLLVYLTAFLPENGQSFAQIKKAEDKKDLPPPIIIMNEDQTLQLEEAGVKDTFYGECSKEDVTKAKENLCRQPLSPLNTPVYITDDNFGKIPRVYIETLKDKALSLKCQREMYTKTPCQQIINMNTYHSPFFSQAEVLASHLRSLSL